MNQFKNMMFHVNEIAICGYSGSGKTTLIEKLISHFDKMNFHVGVVKHDGHKFEMDKEGKDTWRFQKAGAKKVFINDSEKYCLQAKDENTQNVSFLLSDVDFVIVEGNKSSHLDKFIIIDDESEILELINSNELTNIIGIIVKDNLEVTAYKESLKLPVFERNEIQKISHFILNHFHKKTPPLKALILAGGKSQRMGQDKGKLKYFDKYQTQYLNDELSKYVDDVYVSIRVEQKNEEHVKDLNQIHDSFPSKGPISALLSAMDMDPQAAWLVVAVDLPYLDSQTIKYLIKNRNPFKNATCFKNPEKGWPEPLCTIWEPKAKLKLHQYFAIDKNCPRKVLFNSEIQMLNLQHCHALNNCNTLEDFQKAKLHIQNLGVTYATN